MFEKSKTLPSVTQIVDPEEYHSLGDEFKRGEPGFIMSRSNLWDFAQLPHKWLAGKKEKKTKALTFGDLADCVILTKSNVEKRFVVHPETYPCEATKKDPRTEKPWNMAATFCKEWVETKEGEGFTCISSSVMADAQAADYVFSRAKDGWLDRFRSASRAQVQCCADWHDEETGFVIPFKVLLDFMPDPKSEFGDTMGDLKTCRDATFKKWVRQVFDEGYFFQASLYLDVTNAATGLDYRNWEHLIVENTEPFEATHRMLSDDFVKFGRGFHESALKEYCRSLRSGKYRGYDTATTEMESWMLT